MEEACKSMFVKLVGELWEVCEINYLVPMKQKSNTKTVFKETSLVDSCELVEMVDQVKEDITRSYRHSSLNDEVPFLQLGC